MANIQINELARELEVKCNLVLAYLAEIDIAEGMSHTSVLDDELANRVREHFRTGGDQTGRRESRTWVDELACELEVESNLIFDYLASLDIAKIKSFSSPLDKETANKVREWFREGHSRAEELRKGHVARQYFQASSQLAVLQKELQGYLNLFAKLTKALGKVDYVVFDEENWPPGFHGPAGEKQSDYSFSSVAIDGQKLKTLCKEIKAAKAKNDWLADQLKRLGFPLSTNDPS